MISSPSRVASARAISIRPGRAAIRIAQPSHHRLGVRPWVAKHRSQTWGDEHLEGDHRADGIAWNTDDGLAVVLGKRQGLAGLNADLPKPRLDAYVRERLVHEVVGAHRLRHLS